MKQIDAGQYKYQITIYQIIDGKDEDGFPVTTQEVVLQPYAKVKTTKGFTLIANNSDFEKAFTNFTIRYSGIVEDAYYNSANSNRNMLVAFRNKTYEVMYLNNIDEANIEIEMQCKEVMK
jgi:head-tail adaptor